MTRDSTLLLSLFADKRVRRNVRALLRAVLVMLIVVVVESIGFYLIMVHVEGRVYSWITSVYWTLTTMSTLGYGDITFYSDVGYVYSVVVLFSGIVLLFVVLPFTFVRFFLGPWLEAQIRKRTPREVPPGTTGHVVICHYDTIAQGLIERLEREKRPYLVVETDEDVAAEHYFQGVSVVTGAIDDRATFEAVRVDRARLVFVNLEDWVNASVVLTIREVSADVPVVAIAHRESAVAVLEAAGATHVLALNRWLGEQLASRVNASHAQSHVIGRYKDLMVAELPVHHTPLAGQTIRETRLREFAGVSIIGVWERGRLTPARPDLRLTPASVPVVIGTEEQLDELNYLFAIYDVNPNPVLVIGGGDVGLAAARALRRNEIPVHLIERDPVRNKQLHPVCERVFLGDATHPELLLRAGIQESPSVLITTRDDAMNIFLTAHCRRLNPELRIVSRITHERNVETIHHAGADFVLGVSSLGVEATFSILEGRDLVVLGEGVDLFSVPLPRSLFGKTLAESGIGARTGLTVIAVQRDGSFVTAPPATLRLEAGMELLLFGGADQRRQFEAMYGGRGKKEGERG